MMKAGYFLRQMQLVTPTELSFPIAIIGAGGIGSWLTLVLAKMGCTNLTVIDFDKVEKHNVPSQIYVEEQIGQLKVFALANIIKTFTGVQITPVAAIFQETQIAPFLPKVIISAVDSLKQRKNIWLSIKLATLPDVYIDSRMGGETMRLLTIDLKDPASIKRYEKRLASRVKPHREPCTARAIAYNTFAISGLLGSLVKKYAKKEVMKKDFSLDLSSLNSIYA